MKEYFSATDVSVRVVSEHAKSYVKITDKDGNITVFAIVANAAHVGCKGLRITEHHGEVGEEEWLDFELKRVY